MNTDTNIPVYSLYIHPFEITELLFNEINLFDDPTPAHFIFDQQQYEIRIKFRGNHTRNLPKRSYNIKFKNPYRFYNVREIHLNADYLDPSLIRNKLSLDLFQSYGVLSPESQYIQLFMHDNDEGLYLQLESVDDLFLAKRQLPPGPIYYAININANFSLKNSFTKKEKESLTLGYERKVGTNADDYHLIELIGKINKSKNFEKEIVQYLDVDKYLNWLAIAVCTQNLDGFKKNYALYRNSETNLFEIIPWDYDATFGRDWNGEKMEYDRVPIEGYNKLTYKLMKVRKFRKQYRQIMTELLNTKFTRSYLKPKIYTLSQSLRPYLLNSDSLEKFDAEPEYILDFIKNRNRYLRSQLKSLI